MFLRERLEAGARSREPRRIWEGKRYGIMFSSGGEEDVGAPGLFRASEGERDMERDRREELAERLAESMAVIMRSRGNALRRVAGRYGITPPQFFLLKMLNAHGEMTVTGISEVMMVAAPTASRMIANLCEKGWLERRKDPANRRVTLVRLTRKGKGLLHRVGEMQKEQFLELIEQEDFREIEAFIDWLEKFTSRLSNARVPEVGHAEETTGDPAR